MTRTLIPDAMLAADRATTMDFVWIPLTGEEKGTQVAVTEVTDVPTVSLYLSAVF